MMILTYSGGPINSARSNNSAPVHFGEKSNNSARSNNSAPVHFGEEPNDSARSINGTPGIFWKAEDFIQMRKNFYQKRKIWLKSGRRENWLKTGSLTIWKWYTYAVPEIIVLPFYIQITT